VALVVEAHGVIVAATNAESLPAGAQEGESRDVRNRLVALSMHVRKSFGARGSTFAAVLGEYADVIRGVASDTERPTAVGDLRALDGRWKAELSRIGDEANIDLLRGVPTLLLPRDHQTPRPKP